MAITTGSEVKSAGQLTNEYTSDEIDAGIDYVEADLYEKYGFRGVGLRRGYYSDNGEDGLLMSTDTITSDSFQSHFQQLKRAHAQK